ncbi:MAG: energy transducer TonB [Bacteroidales bacterium]|nr:energy transducer TonB [Bacteroidales bacterium]
MTVKHEPVESLEEMVFKNRNKAYGAYMLRKKYKKYIIISMIVAMLVMAGVVAYPIITAVVTKGRILKEEMSVGAEMLDIPQDEPPPPPPPPPPPEALQEKVKFTAPVVVEDTAVESDFGKQDLLAEKVNTEVPSEEPGFGIVEDKPQVIEQPKEAEIFTVVEENPLFPGGEAALYKFLSESIKYPEEAKELGIQGRVFVNFVVETNGSVSKVKVLRGIGGGCDEEAVRVVKSMPRWTPGKQRGIPVRVSYNLPIKFTLQ